LVVIIFIILLILLGLVIYMVIALIPKSDVGLYGDCTHQSDCMAGLVCSRGTGFTGTVCLNGLDQGCATNTECATGLVCIAKTGSTDKTCQPPPPTVSLTADLIFNNNMQQLPLTYAPQQVLRP